MKPTWRHASALLPALTLALAACQGEKKPADGGNAQGEILPGSASDAMLPLNTLRSQPPLAPQTQAAGKPGAAKKGDDAADEEEAEPTADGTASAAPAAAPSAAADTDQ